MTRMFLVLGLLAAAPLASAADAQSADAAYQAQDWAAAAEAYEALAQENPGDMRAQYRQAVAKRHLGRYEEAEKALAAAKEAGLPPQFADLEMVRIRLAQDRPDAALEVLEGAAEAGLSNATALEAEEFAALADEPRFAAVLETVRRNQYPCRYDDKARQFDFWAGRWRVTDASGVVQGENRIEKAQGDCVLVENWSGAQGGTGMSMNLFDPTSGQWRQLWVSSGLIVDIAGGLKDGSMVLEGHSYYHGQDEKRPFRGTWTPQEDGVVRQFFEESTDGGETFAPWFEGFYHPLEENAAPPGSP